MWTCVDSTSNPAGVILWAARCRVNAEAAAGPITLTAPQHAENVRTSAGFGEGPSIVFGTLDCFTYVFVRMFGHRLPKSQGSPSVSSLHFILAERIDGTNRDWLTCGKRRARQRLRAHFLRHGVLVQRFFGTLSSGFTDDSVHPKVACNLGGVAQQFRRGGGIDQRAEMDSAERHRLLFSWRAVRSPERSWRPDV